jgi:hypothetical protein
MNTKPTAVKLRAHTECASLLLGHDATHETTSLPLLTIHEHTALPRPKSSLTARLQREAEEEEFAR